MHDANCTEGGKPFNSMLDGAAYAAVSRDFRSVLHLRSIREFMVCVDRAFIFQGFYVSSELFPFATMMSRANNEEPCRKRCR